MAHEDGSRENGIKRIWTMAYRNASMEMAHRNDYLKMAHEKLPREWFT